MSPCSPVGMSQKKIVNRSCLNGAVERKDEEVKPISVTKDEGKQASVKSGVTSKRLSLKYSASLIDDKPSHMKVKDKVKANLFGLGGNKDVSSEMFAKEILTVEPQ